MSLGEFSVLGSTPKMNGASLYRGMQQPWCDETISAPSFPSLMTGDEAKFLHWLTRTLYCGAGEIVDLGPLGGLSTQAFACGIEASGRSYRGTPLIHSYDLWHFFPDWKDLFPGHSLGEGADLEPIFRDRLGERARWVTSNKGDLLSHQWSSAPIELLFIDLAKSPRLWMHIQTHFFPSLIPGRSLVIQQDFVCGECPWIHVAQAALSEYFVPVDSPAGGTVAFLYKKQIPAELLGTDFWRELGIDQRAKLIEQCEELLTPPWRFCVKMARGRMLALADELEEAEAIIDSVLEDPGYTPVVDFDINRVRDDIQKRR